MDAFQPDRSLDDSTSSLGIGVGLSLDSTSDFHSLSTINFDDSKSQMSRATEMEVYKQVRFKPENSEEHKAKLNTKSTFNGELSSIYSH